MDYHSKISEIVRRFSFRSDFDHNTDLFDAGILDSFGTVQLLIELETAFNIKIGLTEVDRESLMSISAITETVTKRLS